MQVHLPRAHPLVQRVVLDGDVVRERGVVDEHVDRPAQRARALDQRLAFRGLGDVRGDRVRLLALCEPTHLVLSEVLCEPGSAGNHQGQHGHYEHAKSFL